MPAVSLTERAMILNVGLPQGGWINVTYALWFPVTPGNELAIQGFVSQWKDIGAKDAALLAALQSGQVIEQVNSTSFPATLTLVQVEVFIAAAWAAVNAYLAGAPQPGQFYGTYFDGNVWAKA